jgi:hypothetical protein
MRTVSRNCQAGRWRSRALLSLAVLASQGRAGPNAVASLFFIWTLLERDRGTMTQHWWAMVATWELGGLPSAGQGGRPMKWLPRSLPVGGPDQAELELSMEIFGGR